ncbi:MAG: hypothetical protein KF696_14220 [Planctomycetes bacterium]|nr:hypothetical protein [Planctomycetota bacterium]MCW8136849.1 hypothetical protein [Planctomycetota bacterium]
MFWTRWLVAGAAAMAIGTLSLAQEKPGTRAEGKTAEGKTDGKTDEKKTEAGESAPAFDVNKPAPGKLTVVKKTDLKLTDEARKKDVEYVAVFPKEEGKYPVILYSIGQGADAKTTLATPEFLASHGYVVISAVHVAPQQGRGFDVDSLFDQWDANKDGKLSKEELPEQMREFFDTVDTDSDGFVSKDELRAAMGSMPGGGGRGGQQPPRREERRPPEGEDEFSTGHNGGVILLEDPAQPQPEQPRGGQGRGQGRQGRQQGRGGFGNDPGAIVDRTKDLLLVIDQISKVAELKDKVDLENIAVVGHGAGAATALLLAGATYDQGEEKGKSAADKRIKAVVQYGPAQSSRFGFTDESFKKIATPMLAVSGATQMAMGGRGGQAPDPELRKASFKNAPEGGKYFVNIEGASDFDLPGAAQMRAMGGRGGQGSETPQRNETAAHWTHAVTLQFLNATLKADEGAKAWLAGDSLEKGTEGKAKIERK